MDTQMSSLQLQIPQSHRHLTEKALFTAAVKSVFARWSAFNLAMKNQGGAQGKEIGNWILQVTETCIYENSETDGAELGEWIGVLLNNELDTIVEDGSLDIIGNQLVDYWKLVQGKQFLQLADQLDKIDIENPVSEATNNLPKVEDSSDESEDDNDNERNHNQVQDEPMDMEMDDSHSHRNQRSSAPEPDPDGWVTVTKNRKR